jgi:hypothetical protein
VSAVETYLREQSAFCFTTDIEWSAEWAIRDLFELADSSGVPLTPFLTHRSAFLEARFSGKREAANVGVHPNFLPGSTHGRSIQEVIDTMTELWPVARSYRSHCFYDDTRMNRRMTERGFRYDSNLCAFLQPALVPLRTATALIRFPVFWEDDLHSVFGLPWRLDAIARDLETPGLKIFNVHPLRIALNVPDEAFHEENRALNDRPDVAPTEHAHTGDGSRTFLEALFAYAEAKGHTIVTLEQLYGQAVERGVPRAAHRNE